MINQQTLQGNWNQIAGKLRAKWGQLNQDELQHLAGNVTELIGYIQRKTGEAPVYRYHFELAATPSKYHPGTFAFHSDDIEYVFGTLDTRPGWNVRPEDRTLSDQMMSYWTNFAKTGDPNGSGLPKWPNYKDDGYPLIHLNSTITSGPDADRERYLFLDQYMPAMRPGR